jgi:putative hemolysin
MLTFEILTVIFLTCINGLLAMSELAVASSRLPKLRMMAEQGVNGARRAVVLASDPGRFLSTVQIGITLIGILSGAVSGATLGLRLSEWLMAQGLGESIAETLGYGAVIGSITYLSLIIGELVPKQIALTNPERIACLVAPAMTLLARFSSPIVWFLSKSGKIILTLLGKGGAREQTVTDAEIHSMIAEAESSGVIEPEERDMIAGIMRLGDKPARSVMIPRVDVQMVDISESLQNVAKRIAETDHSRFVVFKENQDDVVGIVQAKDIAVAMLKKKVPPLKQLIKDAPTIPDNLDSLEIVARLKESNVHFGLVYDEYGHFEGIVTAADILEAIVGSFKEEKRPIELAISERDDGSLLVAGWSPVDSLLQRINVNLEGRRDYQTVAGLVLDKMGRLPAVGESFVIRDYRFEVVDLDGRRIDKVLVSRQSPSTRRSIT